MSLFVIAEHDNHQLKQSTLSTLSAAEKLGTDIHVLVAGYQCDAVVKALQQYSQIKIILCANTKGYEHVLAESYAALVVHLSEGMTHILAPATTFGKNILPRVAALLDVGQVSDIVAVVDQQTFKRPIYAGNAIATVRSMDMQKVISVRPTAFLPITAKPGVVEVINIDFASENVLSKFLSHELHGGDRPELATADIVVSGGRGLKDKETFNRLTAIADQLGAAIGASRAAVDAGLAPNDYQVGQTGQVVAPKVYIAVGISGAIQHLAGMKDSKVIVAINKDSDAPIFQIADYALVADLFEVLSEWEKILNIGVNK